MSVSNKLTDRNAKWNKMSQEWHRTDWRFVDYFNSDFSISGIASVNEEHVSPHTWLQKTSLSEVEIAKMDPNMHSRSFVYQ